LIARLELQDLELRQALARNLVPPGLGFWARRAALEEDLLTWWAVMVHLQETLASRRPPASAAIAARHFRHLGEVLRLAGATSGAELVDGPPPPPRRKGYGIWHHFRDL
jgi:hypothetical protein